MLQQAASDDIDARFDERLLTLLRAFLRSAARTGRHPARAASDELERLARAYHRRAVADAIEAPRPIADRAALADALSDQKASVAASGAASAIAGLKMLERFGPLKVVAKRTPWLMAATTLPALYASFMQGADELSAMSSFLTNRASNAGLTPDPDRIRRASVQLLQGRSVDTEVEPSHRELVWSWMRRAARSLVPLIGKRGKARVRRLVASAVAVDPLDLSGPSAADQPDLRRPATLRAP